MKEISRTLLIAAITLLTTNNVIAQDKMSVAAEKKYKLAIQYAEESNNQKAISLLQDLYKSHPNNIDITYNLGLCYMNMSGNPDSALFFLNKTFELDTDEWGEEKNELMIAIARVKQLKYDYDGALKAYKQVEAHDANKEWADVIAHERFVCENAKIMINNPVRLQIRRLSEKINCTENDYRPIISDDMRTLIFTSRRKSHVRTRFQDGQNEERTYVSTRLSADGEWNDAELISNLFSSKGQETATCLRDTELYIVRDGDIYISKRDTTGTWQKAENIGTPINSKADENYAYVTPDGSEMFFSSNRDGGFGGFDIYHSFRLPNGNWGVPKNMGSVINTAFDEDAPVKHPTKNILYFSSNGHNTMGGYDIFYTLESIADSTYEAVQNIGYPINTPDDDLYFVPTSVKDMAYYASIKWDNSEDEFTGYDIYEVEYDEPEVNKLVILSGVIKGGNIHNVKITADADGEPLGRYLANSETGKFIIVGEEGRTYHITADNGIERNSVEIVTQVGDSYYKLGHTIQMQTIEFATNTVETLEPQAPIDRTGVGKKQYTIQIMSLRKPLDKSRVKGLDVDQIHEHVYRDGWYVYSYGQFNSIREAKPVKNMIIETTPYNDSFIRNNKQYEKFVKKDNDK